MKLPVIKLGDSFGIRFSKDLIRKYKITDRVEIVEKEDCIELRPSPKPRENWEEAFRQMNMNNDDTLLIDDVFADEISEECC